MTTTQCRELLRQAVEKGPVVPPAALLWVSLSIDRPYLNRPVFPCFGNMHKITRLSKDTLGSDSVDMLLHQLNSSLYEIQYYFDSELGPLGVILPNTSGNVTGIHYSDWSYTDKTNDFSFPNSSTFVRNDNIAVTNSAGELIYGQMSK